MFYALPPFSILGQVLRKIEYDRAKGILVLPNWQTQAWFPLLRRLLITEPLTLNWHPDLVGLPFQQGQHPLGQEAAVDGMFLIRSALNDKGFSLQSIDIILKSWRDSTKKQYLTYVHKWIQFCNMHNLNIFTADIAHILGFLTDLVNTGLTYSAINTARSALSSFLVSR